MSSISIINLDHPYVLLLAFGGEIEDGEGVSHQIKLYLFIEGTVRGERGSMIHLQDVWFELMIKDHVKA